MDDIGWEWHMTEGSNGERRKKEREETGEKESEEGGQKKMKRKKKWKEPVRKENEETGKTRGNLHEGKSRKKKKHQTIYKKQGKGHSRYWNEASPFGHSGLYAFVLSSGFLY